VENNKARLYFIDAMRAWAILMMLQGHFIDGLLDNAFRDDQNMAFSVWKYFRGITAPVFFTVSGFIFTFLLIRGENNGLENPRVKKGIKRGLELLFIGYLLRLNLFGLLGGEIYDSFYLVDVLHCIGLSILGIIGLYLLTQKSRKFVLPITFIGITILLFLFEPFYKQASFSYLPQAIANYITKANGSVFTILPWFGYASFGAFLSIVFTKFKSAKYLYPVAISLSAIAGLTLMFYSSGWFLALANNTGVELFGKVFSNNYLFMRLGDVLVVFAIFMSIRGLLKNPTLLKIGQSTLSIYIIHFMILYGSLTGLGLYRFLDHALHPIVAVPGAVAFMVICSYSALKYETHKEYLKSVLNAGLKSTLVTMELVTASLIDNARAMIYKLLRSFGLVKG
jgi:uncharacterized membrane protein